MPVQITLRSRKNMPLGQLEQFIMLAITHCEPMSYGSNLKAEIKDRTGIDLTVGNLYGTLERLINKELIGYTETKIARSKAKKRFYLTAKGHQLLAENVKMVEKMMFGYTHHGA